MTDQERREVDRIRLSLGDWALGDVRKTAAADAPVGAFILAGQFIDALALLSGTKAGKGRLAWREFIPTFLPAYAELEDDRMYLSFRCRLTHQYSLTGFRLVAGEEYRDRHWQEESGDRVLHLETFLDEVTSAWTLFLEKLETDDAFRSRVLSRTRPQPVLAVVHEARPSAEEIRASLLAITPGATHFGTASAAVGAAHAASGAPPLDWYETPSHPIKFVPKPKG